MRRVCSVVLVGYSCVVFMCNFMRFSTCHALIAKRGFFIYQNFFTYDTRVSDYIAGSLGAGNLPRKLFMLWFETHGFLCDTTLPISGYGQQRSMAFGYFLLGWFVPHGAFRPHSVWHLIRLFKILTYRGRRHAQGLPVRGQRTHSNSAQNV